VPTLCLCPDREFALGGCDYAEIESRKVAFLYEKKSCAWNPGKAAEAIGQLDKSASDLIINGFVDNNCQFSRFIIREKDSPHCRTFGSPAAEAERRGARFIAAESEIGRKILARYERKLSTYPL
jgi:hypothetical protein